MIGRRNKIVLDPDAVTDTSARHDHLGYLLFGLAGVLVGLLIGFLIWWTP